MQDVLVPVPANSNCRSCWYILKDKSSTNLAEIAYDIVKLGLTLPAFLSPNVAKVLIDNFGIGGITNVEDDMKMFMEA